MTTDRLASLEHLAACVERWIQAEKASRALRGDFKLQLAAMDAKRAMLAALVKTRTTEGPAALATRQAERLRESMGRASVPPDAWTCGAT